VTPVLWSLPTAFMIAELSSALPAEGGYYALGAARTGKFLGISGSVASWRRAFRYGDYPTLFVAYLTQVAPWFRAGHRGVLVGLFVVAACAALNIAAFAWWDHFVVAVFLAVDAIRTHRFAFTF